MVIQQAPDFRPARRDASGLREFRDQWRSQSCRAQQRRDSGDRAERSARDDPGLVRSQSREVYRAQGETSDDGAGPPCARAAPDLELIRGDLRDFESVERAVAGCDQVYHVAADYRLWLTDPAPMYATNFDGTRHILRAAVSAGVSRIVHTSTVGALGIPHNGVGREDAPSSLAEMPGHYKRSKFMAEQLALEAARAGAPVVIVNPSTPIGALDFKPTPTGRIIVDFLTRRIPAYVETGLNVVDVEDVARGHLLAAERGRVGEKYILGGENLTLKEFLARLAAISAMPAPKVRIPYAVAV